MLSSSFLELPRPEKRHPDGVPCVASSTVTVKTALSFPSFSQVIARAEYSSLKRTRSNALSLPALANTPKIESQLLEWLLFQEPF